MSERNPLSSYPGDQRQNLKVLTQSILGSILWSSTVRPGRDLHTHPKFRRGEGELDHSLSTFRLTRSMCCQMEGGITQYNGFISRISQNSKIHAKEEQLLCLHEIPDRSSCTMKTAAPQKLLEKSSQKLNQMFIRLFKLFDRHTNGFEERDVPCFGPDANRLGGPANCAQGRISENSQTGQGSGILKGSVAAFVSR